MRTNISPWPMWISIPLILALTAPLHLCDEIDIASNASSAYSPTADRLKNLSDSAYSAAIDETTLWELVRESQEQMPIIANALVGNEATSGKFPTPTDTQKANESNNNAHDVYGIADLEDVSPMNEKTSVQPEDVENLLHLGYSGANCQIMAQIETCPEIKNTDNFLWYYDQIEKQCLSTSDCISNENRFESEADCKSTCLPKSPISRCLAPPKAGFAQCSDQKGPSTAIQKAYFDKALESCSWFVYLGCGGSDNQFASIEECNNTCLTPNALATIRQSAQKICELPHTHSDGANCEDVGQTSSRWYYDPHTQLCKEFGYSHCSGTANTFLSKFSCELFCGAKTLSQEAICQLQPEFGDCKSQLDHEMWFYDNSSGDCRTFIYSGCGGNDNRFSSHSGCRQTCRPQAQGLQSEAKLDASHLEKEDKTLESNARTSFEDALVREDEVQAEKTFIETGHLRKPLKLFLPLVYNLTAFAPQSVDIEPCSERAEPGQCGPINCSNTTECQSKRFVRWFFNPRTSNCENFAYTGCGGSANTFDSAQSCSIACKQRILRPDRDKRCNNNPRNDGCYSLPLPQDRQVANETTEVCFYFSVTSGTCRAFHLKTDGDRCERQSYFPDGQECLKACVKSSPTERDLPNRCFARKLNSGNTRCPIERHNISRWSYLPDLQQCVLFFQCHNPDESDTSAWGNNFETEELCIATCIPKGLKDVCRLPKDTGPCSGSHARYYYDPVAGKCRLFMYGGCLGNGNRFSTKAECEDACGELTQIYDTGATLPEVSNATSTHVVKVEPVPDEVIEEMRRIKILYSERYPWDFCLQHHTYGTCPRPRGLHDRSADHDVHLTRYFYNRRTKRCESYFYTGCGARGNHFETKLQCDSICTRRLRQSASPRCDASKVEECQGSELRLWIYEAEAGTCRQVEVCSIPKTTSSSSSDPFRWQMGVANAVFRLRPGIGSPGSAANGINGNLLPGTFTSSSACHNHCLPPTPSGTDVTNICHMNPITSVSNECRMMVNRWYFDVKDGYCRSYISCPVYGNNFADEKACNSACRPKHISDVCRLPLDYGGCSRYLQRWYYNTEKRICEPFSYGGCFGNSNRFLTKQECDIACTQTDICGLPKPKEAEGNEPSTLRYYFNQTTGVCEKFFFSGKIPQGNNFVNEAICHNLCISAPNLLPISVKINKMAFSMDRLATKFGHVMRHSTLPRGHKATCLSSPQLLNIVKNETIQNCHPGGTVAELAYAYDVVTNTCYPTMIYVCLDYPNEPYRMKILGRQLIFESQGHCESECLQSER